MSRHPENILTTKREACAREQEKTVYIFVGGSSFFFLRGILRSPHKQSPTAAPTGHTIIPRNRVLQGFATAEAPGVCLALCNTKYGVVRCSLVIVVSSAVHCCAF